MNTNPNKSRDQLAWFSLYFITAGCAASAFITTTQMYALSILGVIAHTYFMIYTEIRANKTEIEWPIVAREAILMVILFALAANTAYKQPFAFFLISVMGSAAITILFFLPYKIYWLEGKEPLAS